MKMQFSLELFDITKISGKKNVDVSRTQGVCHVICIFFESSLVFFGFSLVKT